MIRATTASLTRVIAPSIAVFAVTVALVVSVRPAYAFDIDNFADLQAELSNDLCLGIHLVLTRDILEPTQSLTTAPGCAFVVSLAGHNLAVRNIVIGSNAILILWDEDGGGSVTVDASGVPGLAGIRTTGATLFIEGTTVTVTGGAGTGGGGGGAAIGGDGGVSAVHGIAGDSGGPGGDGNPGLSAGSPGSGGLSPDGEDGGTGGPGQDGGTGSTPADGAHGGHGGVVKIYGSEVTATGGAGGDGGGGGAAIGGGGGGAGRDGGTGGDGGNGGNGGNGGSGGGPDLAGFDEPGGDGGRGGDGGPGGQGGNGGDGSAGGDGGDGGTVTIDDSHVWATGGPDGGSNASGGGAGIGGGGGGAGGDAGNGGDGGHAGNGGGGGVGGSSSGPSNPSGGNGGDGGHGGRPGDGGDGGSGGDGGDGGDGGTLLLYTGAEMTTAGGADIGGGADGIGAGRGGAGGNAGDGGRAGDAGAAGSGGSGHAPGGTAGSPGTDGPPGDDGGPGSAGATGASGSATTYRYGLRVLMDGAGTGTVTGVPGTINCLPNCDQTFTPGSVVTLDATPDAGSTFDGWSGATCPGSVVTMSAPATCIATFAVATATPPVQVAPPPVDIEVGGITLPVSDIRRTPVVPGDSTEVQTTNASGDAAHVTLPPGALPEGAPPGTTLDLGTVDLDALLTQAPIGDGPAMLASFLTRLTDASGEPVPGAFDPPGTVTLTLRPETLGDTPAEDLVLVRWTPLGWVEVPAERGLAADGTVTLRAALLEQPAVLAVVAASEWGTFTMPPAATGPTLTTWHGGGYQDLDAALGGRTAWVTVGGEFIGYVPGAPDFANAAFRARFPDGLPASTPMIVVG